MLEYAAEMGYYGMKRPTLYLLRRQQNRNTFVVAINYVMLDTVFG